MGFRRIEMDLPWEVWESETNTHTHCVGVIHGWDLDEAYGRETCERDSQERSLLYPRWNDYVWLQFCWMSIFGMLFLVAKKGYS